MAAIIGDVFDSSARFGVIRGHSHSHDIDLCGQRSVSRSRDRDRDAQSHNTPRPTAPSPRRHAHTHAPFAIMPMTWRDSDTQAAPKSRIPSPPPSSSCSSSSQTDAQTVRNEVPSDTTSAVFSESSTTSSSSASEAPTVVAVPAKSIPSPDHDRAPAWASSTTTQSIPIPLSVAEPVPPQQTTIRVRDIAHITSLVKSGTLSASGPGTLNDPPLQQMKYDISAMPIADIIEMIAALLTKITTTNDMAADVPGHHHRGARNLRHSKKGGDKDGSVSPLASSVLAFHGKNIPAITILSYLTRIHKYCPTTFEVFLSLLVYFDRMTERVNQMVTEVVRARESNKTAKQREPPDHDREDKMEVETVSVEGAEDLIDDEDEEQQGEGDGQEREMTYFVVDSFNIHRLIIAGVTCASKFFSDVFYTNSRYAKVGGLPLAELNHLELQFLLLNDFRLAVPVEDLEAYATMLVEFYAREVICAKLGRSS